MTVEERAAEIERLMHAKGEQLLAEGFRTFGDVHQRLEELMGRPVWTHEMARPEQLAVELRTGERPSMEQIIDKVRQVNPDVEVIVVVADSAEGGK